MKGLRARLGMTYAALAIVLAMLLILTSYFLAKDAITTVSDGLLVSSLETELNLVWNTLHHDYGELTLVDGQLQSEDGENPADNHLFVDKASEKDYLSATVFVKEGDDFKRISTNILNEKGERAVGTMLGKDSAAYETVMSGQTYMGEAEILGRLFLTAYRPIENNGDVIGILFIGVDEALVNVIATEQAGRLFTILMILLIVVVVAAVAASWLIGGLIAGPLSRIKVFTENIAQGDLTVELNQSKVNFGSEIEDVSKSVMTMHQSLKDLIVGIQQSSEASSDLGDEIKNIAKQTSTALDEISTTVYEISEGATHQAMDAENGRNMTVGIGDVIEENYHINDELRQTGIKLAEVASEGAATVAVLERATDVVGEAQQSIRVGVAKTNDSAEKILVASELIDSIASQTNLLALNASIEAARAGEHGKGFAVVAEEIRKLAEQSKESNAQIQEVINELKVNAGLSVEHVEKASDAIEEQVRSVAATKEGFADISTSISAFESKVALTQEKGAVMNEKRAAIMSVMDTLASVAEENAASTQETSASTEEISASMEEVVGRLEQLVELNEQLNDKTKVFTT